MGSSIFSSNTSQHRWVDQLNEHFVIYVDNPPSIFQVPKSVRDTNPEAYAPQQIGMGAYHHLRPDLDDMESRKLEAVKKLLKPEQYQNFKSLIVDKVRALEPSIRSCYNKYLDLDGDTLAWVMAIDGVYLLHLLSTYSRQKTVNSDDRKVAQDILMMENQLPCIVLTEIKKALQPPEGEDKKDEVEDVFVFESEGHFEVEDDKDLFSEMLSFCESHTPLDLVRNARSRKKDEVEDEVDFEDEEDLDMELFSEMLSFRQSHTPLDRIVGSSPLSVRGRNSPHLLDIMYRLIMFKMSEEKPIRAGVSLCLVTAIPGQVKQVAKVAADLTGLKPLLLLENLPLQEFFDLFKKDNDTTNSSTEEIEIPSASQLHQVSKIQFSTSDHSGSAIKYNKNTRTLYLPVIRLNTDSEVILRNLVAYELASGSDNNVISGYVDFMCGIIDTAKDVDLLKEKGIIESGLLSEEIAKIFNGINKSSRMKPDLENTTQKLNSTYGGTFRVRSWRFIKNHLIPSEASVKLFLGILLVLLLTLQAFCQVYGCSARWFGKISSI